MLLRDLMWDVFQNTGDVAAYLLYRKYLADQVFDQEGTMPEND